MIAARHDDERATWLRLLRHLGTCNTTKASAAWTKAARAASAPLDPAVVAAAGAEWASRIAHARWQPVPPSGRHGTEAWTARVQWQRSVSITVAHQLGVVWLTTLHGGPAAAVSLADVTEYAARQPNDLRTSLAPVGAAAIRALASVDGDDALAQLSRLTLRLRWPKLKKLAVKERDRVIAARGLDADDVAESLVPDFGLRGGVATLAVGDGAATLTLGRTDKPSVAWRSADGKASRVMPKALKAFAAPVRQTVDDVEKMRAAQRTRLDLLMRRRRAWLLDVWRTRYSTTASSARSRGG